MKRVLALLVVGVGVVAFLLFGRLHFSKSAGGRTRSSASSGEGVDGFQGLKWGMSIDDVKNDPIWSQADLRGNSESRTKTLIATSKVEVQGEKVPLAMAFFIDGSLESVGLTYDLSWERVTKLQSILNKKYSDRAGSLESYQETALKTGLDPKISISWERDTILLTSGSLPGVGRTLQLIYRRAGMGEKVREIEHAEAKKNVKDL